MVGLLEYFAGLFLVRGSLVHGSLFMERGSWFMVRCLVVPRSSIARRQSRIVGFPRFAG
jgi:hypothetical protein